MASLGRLERVDLRNIWISEASDFTPWLAQPNNLSVLADAIGMELELEAQERSVGPFRADLLCKNINDDHWVLIENQLERTDHTHLGQLLTYAAGLQAVTIVWVAARFTPEHRAALDWLNEITDQSFAFFGLEVELWKIGDSPAAPKFNVISRPNDWTRDVGQAARRIENETLTDRRQKQLAFWTMLRAYLEETRSPIKAQKPFPQHWTNFSIGRGGIHLSATTHSTEHRLGVELYLDGPSAKQQFYALLEQKGQIESELGTALNWMELPDRKASRIVLFKSGVDPMDESNWSQSCEWLKAQLEAFNTAFRDRVRDV